MDVNEEVRGVSDEQACLGRSYRLDTFVKSPESRVYDRISPSRIQTEPVRPGLFNCVKPLPYAALHRNVKVLKIV